MLSLQEIKIIKHSANGSTAKEIARLMDCEPRTIESYLERIKRKLKARNVAHAVYIAAQGWVIEKR